MKLFESNYTFPHSWSILTAATWRKYPNDLSAHVLSCDVVGRSYDPVSGKLRTERLICCKQNAPAILRRLGLPIPELAYFREVSEVNPKTLVHEAKTYNLTLRNILTVEETCRYTPVLIGRSGGGSGSTGGGGTHFSHTCQVTSSWAAVGNYIEAAAGKLN